MCTYELGSFEYVTTHILLRVVAKLGPKHSSFVDRRFFLTQCRVVKPKEGISSYWPASRDASRIIDSFIKHT